MVKIGARKEIGLASDIKFTICDIRLFFYFLKIIYLDTYKKLKHGKICKIKRPAGLS